MIFTSIEFLVLFLLSLGLYWKLPRRGQNVLLLAVSYFFYGYIHAWFCALLAISTLADFACGLGMARFPTRKRLLLIVSLVVNLGMLGAFKYFDFFIENVNIALSAAGLGTSLPSLRLLLPIGISFYTFQTLSYTLDVYRGVFEPRRNLLEFAVFVSLFAQLVAGPIERARDLLPQIEKERRIDFDRIESGICLIVWGYFTKLVVADNAALYVDQLYAEPTLSGLLVVAAALAFLVQVFADFSGYTDIARGCARLLGFELRRNFNAPFAAPNVPEFWKRWHMSLSTWIRDYVFRSLPNPRHSKLVFTFNSIFTMVLFGFWHGANWNFILWGLFAGFSTVAYLIAIKPLARRAQRAGFPRPLLRMGGIALTFTSFLFGIFLVFRQQDLSVLVGYFTERPFTHTPEDITVALGILLAVVLLALPLIARLALFTWFRPGRNARVVLCWVCLTCIVFLAREGEVDFIYFAF